MAIGVAVALRLRAKRETSATISVTAKVPGKVAIVYYSQSKVQNTALIARWIQKHAGGMVYTSVENIHKVIDPLFMNDLPAELAADGLKPAPPEPEIVAHLFKLYAKINQKEHQ